MDHIPFKGNEIYLKQSILEDGMESQEKFGILAHKYVLVVIEVVKEAAQQPLSPLQ